MRLALGAVWLWSAAGKQLVPRVLVLARPLFIIGGCFAEQRAQLCCGDCPAAASALRRRAAAAAQLWALPRRAAAAAAAGLISTSLPL
ncbi:MAG: hypothetical protein J3K34DRAFT_437684 [Monoraphidium minutum]|nr:MAG: hypothetical protein J3K34DRAFT_437684 [Monoraphidium minutum]